MPYPPPFFPLSSLSLLLLISSNGLSHHPNPHPSILDHRIFVSAASRDTIIMPSRTFTPCSCLSHFSPPVLHFFLNPPLDPSPLRRMLLVASCGVLDALSASCPSLLPSSRCQGIPSYSSYHQTRSPTIPTPTPASWIIESLFLLHHETQSSCPHVPSPPAPVDHIFSPPVLHLKKKSAPRFESIEEDAFGRFLMFSVCRAARQYR